MAREATITQEQVSAAANAIRASGTKPTARSVREQLGTGSMGTVHQFMQVWLADQKGQAGPSLTLPPALQGVIVDHIRSRKLPAPKPRLNPPWPMCSRPAPT